MKKEDLKHYDLVESPKGTRYIMINPSDGGELWDFKAWNEGFYDAYIPVNEFEFEEAVLIGNLEENPELTPEEVKDVVSSMVRCYPKGSEPG